MLSMHCKPQIIITNGGRAGMKRKCVICGFDLCDKMETNQTFDYCCWDVPEEYIHVTPREYFCKYCTEFSS